eukprot:tig00000145_g8795.t1
MLAHAGSGPLGSPSPAAPGDNVRVVVRIRPLSEGEYQRGETVCISTSEDGVTAQVGGMPGKTMGAKAFQFNRVFDEYAVQQTIFEQSGVIQLIDSALRGYAATVFAYGQTGSGKTYSMSGVEEIIGSDTSFKRNGTEGLIPRSIQYMFDEIARAPPGVRYTVRASYLEIYNEQIFDLLNVGSGNLPIRYSSKQGFFVENLFVVECQTMEDVTAVFQEGTRNRTVGSHALNKDSSRSHSIMTVFLEHEVPDPVDGRPVARYGKVSFVDLAGSERLKDSKSEGSQVKETTNINRSLFTLGKVISALGEKGSTHVPYRDSKLTKLLMDSLGGSSLTLMIACCAPSARHLEETCSTLYYASRARHIRNRPVVQMDASEALIAALRRENALLRNENSFLKQSLAAVYGPAALQDLPPLPPASSHHHAPAASPHLHPRLQPAPPPRLPPSSSAPRSGGGGPGGPTAAPPHPTGPAPPASSPSPPSAPPHGRLGAAGPRSRSQPQPPLDSDVPESPQRPGPAPLSARRLDSPLRPAAGPPAILTAPYPHAELLRQLQQAHGLLQQYAVEVERMQAENDALRGAREVGERDFQDIVGENERLASKLEALERVFGSNAAPDELLDVGQAARPAPGLRSVEGSPARPQGPPGGGEGGGDLEALRGENEGLRAALEKARHENATLSAALHNLQVLLAKKDRKGRPGSAAGRPPPSSGAESYREGAGRGSGYGEYAGGSDPYGAGAPDGDPGGWQPYDGGYRDDAPSAASFYSNYRQG